MPHTCEQTEHFSQQSCKFVHSHLCEGDSYSSVMELEGEVLGLLTLRGDCTNPMPRAECSGIRFGLLSVLRAGEEGICLDSEAEVDDAGDLGLWPRLEAGESNASSFQPPRPRSLDLRTGLAAKPTEVRVGSPEANIFAVCKASLTAALTCGILSRRQLSNACKWVKSSSIACN